MSTFDPAHVLDGLYDFQRRTAEHAFRRLFLDPDSTRRFLVADETGLGKTHVARGVLARTIEHLADDPTVTNINVVYVCSNADIASQNLQKLDVIGNTHRATADRLTLLIQQPHILRPEEGPHGKPVTFAAFTPGTSFNFGFQDGQARERVVLYLLFRDHLELSRAEVTALQRVFQGSVSSRQRFVEGYVQWAEAEFDPDITRAFLGAADRSGATEHLRALVYEVAGSAGLTDAQRRRARELTGSLRELLARESINVLNPDLIILDEFQRFRALLDRDNGGAAADLAHRLFEHERARVLLLSATPYKAYTLAEEQEDGEDHYEDFIRTLGFLAGAKERVEPIQQDLRLFRHALTSGGDIRLVRDRLQHRLTRLLARTERPSIAGYGMLAEAEVTAGDVRAEDFRAYRVLHQVARAVDAPLTVEYWKSAPYFLNFLDGYRVGERLRDRLKTEEGRAELQPLLSEGRRLDPGRIERFEPVEWANARMRRLAADTVERGWWRQLWMPPSLPYHDAGGAYAAPEAQEMTKRLIFSSWTAAPSSIAALLSYEAERQVFNGRLDQNTAEARRRIRPRLAMNTTDGRPNNMPSLALFLPQPELARLTDPLLAAREAGSEPLSVDGATAWAEWQVRGRIADSGADDEAGLAQPWRAALRLAWNARDEAEVIGGDDAHNAISPPRSAGHVGDEDAEDAVDGIRRHIDEALEACRETPQRGDLRVAQSVALIGLAAPGNVAWRAIQRLRREDDGITSAAHWRAAATIASAFRNLFNRPETIALLDQLMAHDEGAYWQAVLRYSLDGNLQAVLDEYLFHLAPPSGLTSDKVLLDLAEDARRAIAMRPARYRAVDPLGESDGIPLMSRFALRFGNLRRDEQDARLPEIRNAFNSPFWPFVLATTSIGQEGVDFHWWCHAVVHWNLPANPVDFEQREGRVNRFRGHAVRKNVAKRHRHAGLASDAPWSALFEAAALDDDHGAGDLHPHWIFPGPAAIERHILAMPLSRDHQRWERLRESLTLYRLAFGQPRQEDFLALLAARGVRADADNVTGQGLDLRPLGE